MINTVVVEDNMFMQKHFANMFAANERFHVVEFLRDAFEAEPICADKSIDLVLMDVQTLHNHSGIAAGERIRQASPGTKVVVVTSLVDPEILEKAKNSVDSLWYKDHGDADIMDVIERTLAGEHVFPDESPTVELKDMLSTDLTDRQLAILRYFAHGFSYVEIAEKMEITKGGVKWNLDKIAEMSGFENRHKLLSAVIDSKFIMTLLEEK